MQFFVYLCLFVICNASSDSDIVLNKLSIRRKLSKRLKTPFIYLDGVYMPPPPGPSPPMPPSFPPIF